MTTPGIPTPARPCLKCSKPTTNKGGRCDLHTRQRVSQHNARNAYYQSSEWRALRRACLDRDHSRCVVCTDTYRLTAHHIHARELGGADAIENLTTLCGRCHSSLEAGDAVTATRVREHVSTMRAAGLDN